MSEKLAKPQSLYELLSNVVSENELKVEWKQTVVTGLTVDSRKVESGNCFIAYPGHSVDGRGFLSSAVQAGAACALVEEKDFSLPQQIDVPVVAIADLQSKLGLIANNFYGQPSQKLKLLAVTGTNGKTSVTQLVASALIQLQKKAGVIGTLGNGIYGQLNETENTTPDVIVANRCLAEMSQAGANYVAMETSSHGLVQGRLDGIDLHIGLITNISRDHLDYHGTMEAYREAKSLLAKNPSLNHLILNADDELVISMEKMAQPHVNIWSYSQRHQSCVSVTAAEIQFHSRGMRILVEFNGKREEIKSSLVGEFNGSNLLAAATALIAFGFSLAEVCAALSKVGPVEGRMQALSTSRQQPSVVIDFAHTPDALEKALLALRRHCSGKLWCVFGCGGDRDPGKRPQMAEVVARLADEMVLTADNPRSESVADIIAQMVKGIPEHVAFQIVEDRAEAVKFAIAAAKPDDVVLLAGKGHEAYQEISGVKYEYSDVVVAKQAITALSEKGGC